MNGVGVLLGLGVAGATPRPVGTTGGPLPADGVVRVAFEGVPQSLVTVDDGVVEGPVSLLETRCTTAKDRDTELCVFGFPEEVPAGCSRCRPMPCPRRSRSSMRWTSGSGRDGCNSNRRPSPSARTRTSGRSSSTSTPCGTCCRARGGYVLEIRDEYGRAVDWRTIPVDAPASVAASTRSWSPVVRSVFGQRSRTRWIARSGRDPGNSDMPGQSDSTRRGCAVSPLGSTGRPAARSGSFWSAVVGAECSRQGGGSGCAMPWALPRAGLQSPTRLRHVTDAVLSGGTEMSQDITDLRKSSESASKRSGAFLMSLESRSASTN